MSNHNVSSSHNQDRYNSLEKKPVPRSVTLIHSQTTIPRPQSPFTGARRMTPYLPQQKPGLFFRMGSHCSDSSSKRTIREGANTIHRLDEATENKSWNVEQVEEINPLFPIERSHEVIDHLTPSEIACNVFNFLNGQSIDAVYNDQEAVAYAQTPKGCKFRVHLFKPNDSNGVEGGNGDHDSSVLVEVQRRSGCCVKFHSLAMKILCAAKGCEYKPECPHYTIDTHTDLECAECDLFNSSGTRSRNFVGTAY